MNKTAVALVLAAVSGCVAVTYQHAGQHITPRAGQTLVLGRVRFFHDGREFFPWGLSLVESAGTNRPERHLWLLRLGRRAISAELHPDPDGSLAIWLASGDYALLGSTQLLSAGSAPYEVVALLRVPAGPIAAYMGELTMATETPEGWHVSYSELGGASVAVLPIDTARARLEPRFGALPEALAVSPWCAGEHLSGFNDSELVTRARDSWTAAVRVRDPPSAQRRLTRPMRLASQSMVSPTPSSGTSSWVSRLPRTRSEVWEAHGGLGPARENDVTFRVGPATNRMATRAFARSDSPSPRAANTRGQSPTPPRPAQSGPGPPNLPGRCPLREETVRSAPGRASVP